MPAIDMKATGANIRTLCHNKGIAVSDIISKAGVSKTAVYKWFRGDSVPSVDNIVILASMFGTKMDDVIVTKNVGVC